MFDAELLSFLEFLSVILTLFTDFSWMILQLLYFKFSLGNPPLLIGLSLLVEFDPLTLLLLKSLESDCSVIELFLSFVPFVFDPSVFGEFTSKTVFNP